MSSILWLLREFVPTHEWAESNTNQLELSRKFPRFTRFWENAYPRWEDAICSLAVISEVNKHRRPELCVGSHREASPRTGTFPAGTVKKQSTADRSTC